MPQTVGKHKAKAIAIMPIFYITAFLLHEKWMDYAFMNEMLASCIAIMKWFSFYEEALALTTILNRLRLKFSRIQKLTFVERRE